MAPKRSTPVDNPPASSSEEEETTSSGEEEEGESSSEDEQPTKVVKRPNTSIKQAKSVPESESATESDSESQDVPASNVKPIASKPMEETPSKSRKPTTKKRGIEVDKDAKDSKRSKVKVSESNGAEDTKKQLFQRKWSEDDEVVLLKGVVSFIEKKGIDPLKNLNAFHDFIKKSLHFDVSLNQLKDKLGRLKKKFGNQVKKDKNGEGKTFSKPHDQELFDLSKKLWGSEGVSKSVEKELGEGVSKSLKKESGEGVKKGEKVDKMEKEMENHICSKDIAKFDKGGSVGTMGDYVIKRGLDLLEGAEKSKMEEKWRKLHLAELELFVKRNELITEQARLMLASYKSM